MRFDSTPDEIRREFAAQWAAVPGCTATERVLASCEADLRSMLAAWVPVDALGAEAGEALLDQRRDMWAAILGPAGMVDRVLRHLNCHRIGDGLAVAEVLRLLDQVGPADLDGAPADPLGQVERERRTQRGRAVVLADLLAHIDNAHAEGLPFYPDALPVLGLEDGMYMAGIGSVQRYFYRNLTAGEVLNQLRGYVVEHLGRTTANSPPLSF